MVEQTIIKYGIKWISIILLSTGFYLKAEADGRLVVEKDTFYLMSTCPLCKVPNLEKQVGFGYDALWRLERNILYLEQITRRGQEVDLKTIFKDYLKKGAVVASWFSGELQAGKGKVVTDFTMPQNSRYEQERRYRLENGKVVAQEVIANTRKEATVDLEKTWYSIFNPDHLPWGEDNYLLIDFLPWEDGSLQDIRVVYMDEELGEDSPFVREAKACAALLPDWTVVTIEGKIQPVQLFYDRSWKEGVQDQVAEEHPQNSLALESKTYTLLANPLLQDMNVFSAVRRELKGEFDKHAPQGCSASWKVEDGQLFLTGIRGEKTGKEIPLSLIGPGNNGKAVPATWFTGKLWGRSGSLAYSRYGLKNLYENEAVLYIREGKVLGMAQYDNFTVPGDTAVENAMDRTIQASPEWKRFPELKGCMIHGSFTIFPRLDGMVQRIELESLTVTKTDGQGKEIRLEEIEDETHPYVETFKNLLEQLHALEIRIVHGEIQPLSWVTRITVME